MSEFGWNSTTDGVLDGCDLSGKRVLVTGVSAGLGIETARAFWAHGAEVIGAVRDLEKARAAINAVDETFAGELRLVELDLASLDSVRACAQTLLNEGIPFDIIVANAGIMATPFGRTVDGFETQIGVNHLGHFLLVNLLAPLIREGGRVVSLSSLAHLLSDVDLEDLNFESREYDPAIAYAASKTATILFMVEFDHRYRDRNIRGVAVHPGAIQTELMRYVTPEIMGQMHEKIVAAAGGAPPEDFQLKSVAQGAATTVWAATAPGDIVGGRYCEDCHVAAVSETGGAGVRPYAVDGARAKLLWNRSEVLLGERFPRPL